MSMASKAVLVLIECEHWSKLAQALDVVRTGPSYSRLFSARLIGIKYVLNCAASAV